MTTSDQQGPLTRKQLREIRLTGSTPVISSEEAAATPPVPPRPRVAEPVKAAPTPPPAADSGAGGGVPLTRRQAREQAKARTGSLPVTSAEQTMKQDSDEQPTEALNPGAIPLAAVSKAEQGDAPADDGDIAHVHDADDTEVRPTVNSAFGEGVLADATDANDAHAPFRPSFDELLNVGDSTGSQHSAPNALIFTPSPGEGSLSGPVASTGEILITGSYELPQGMGSHGHPLGTTDGKDIDAVLIDGELPAASSPTPIAASSAVSTIKPAGEVIRPPAPEKGNRLMLILAIVAGGLALGLGVVLVFAFTTNVF